MDFTDLNKACPKVPFPISWNRPTSGCDCRLSSDEIYRWLSGVPPNCRKIWFCISYKTHSGSNKHGSISFMIDNMYYVNFRI